MCSVTSCKLEKHIKYRFTLAAVESFDEAVLHRPSRFDENVRKRYGAEGGVEPARPFGQQILSPVIGPLPNLTKRYEPVFTRLAVLKVSLRLASYQRVPSPSLAPLYFALRLLTHKSQVRQEIESMERGLTF